MVKDVEGICHMSYVMYVKLRDDLKNMYNSGWVYQFNAIPQNELNRDRSYWMKRIYEELYEK